MNWLPLVALGTLLASSAGAQTLKEQLDAKRAEFLGKTPSAVAKSYQDGIDAVAATGIVKSAKQVGDKAPDFTLNDASGKPIQLSRLLEKGPVVLTWYRGGWCPYCNLALRALQKHLPEIKAAGGQLVALTSEKPDYSLDTAQKDALEFTVLSDLGLEVAHAYGVAFKMPPEIAAAMNKNAKLRERNGTDSDELPLGAAYVIAPDGTITFAFLDADYRNRAEPADMVAALKKLPPSAPKKN